MRVMSRPLLTPPVVSHGAADLELLANRGVFCARTRTLVVADVHLGKAETFVRAGVPIPLGASSEDIDRLVETVDTTGATTLVVGGDLIHDRAGLSDAVVEAFAQVLARPDLTVVLVTGNHERSAGRLPAAWRTMVQMPSYRLGEGGPLVLHEPASDCGPVIAGHLHPMARVGQGKHALVLPAFARRGEVLLLPAFTAWSSGVRVTDRDERWVIVDGRVIALPGRRTRG